MDERSGLERLRDLARRRRELDAEIDQATEELLRAGEFVDDIAAVLGESRETVRRFRASRNIPDSREIRREKGLPARRANRA